MILYLNFRIPFTQAETVCQEDAKRKLKIMAKENCKVIGRQIGKFSHSGPIIVYTDILSRIEAFENLIPFVIDAFKYSTDFSRDCMSYCLVSQLRKDSCKLKDGDTHYNSWFTALCKLIGLFYKKFYQTEVKGIFHFLLQRLRSGESLDLLVLKELLQKMGGCDTVLEISHAQLGKIIIILTLFLFRVVYCNYNVSSL